MAGPEVTDKMAVLLSMFNTRMGPVAFKAIPEHFNEALVKKTAKLMDFFHEQDEFFIQDYPEDGIKSINMAFTIDSAWARGKKEILQVSVFTTEESPPVDAYKAKLHEFKEKLSSREYAYMSFYTGNRQEYVPQLADRDRFKALARDELAWLEGLMRWLDENVKIDAPATHAYATSLEALASTSMLAVPRSALNEIRDLVRTRDVENTFIVFRKVGDMVKADIIPCGPLVIKVRIVVERLTPELIMTTSKIIALPLLFTSGICQEKAGKCSYEAYFSVAPGNADQAITRIRSGLSALAFVETVEIKTVTTS